MTGKETVVTILAASARTVPSPAIGSVAAARSVQRRRLACRRGIARQQVERSAGNGQVTYPTTALASFEWNYREGSSEYL